MVLPNLITVYGLVDSRNPDCIRYVGATSRPRTRLREHVRSDDSPKSAKALWIRSVIDSGADVKMVKLSCCKTREGAFRAERRWIAKLDNVINETDGGVGGAMKGEALKRRNASHKRAFANGLKHPMKGKKHSEDSRKKMRDAAIMRITNGTSHLCDPEHQRKASAKSSKGKGLKRSAAQKKALSEKMKQWWAERKSHNVSAS